MKLIFLASLLTLFIFAILLLALSIFNYSSFLYSQSNKPRAFANTIEYFFHKNRGGISIVKIFLVSVAMSVAVILILFCKSFF